MKTISSSIIPAILIAAFFSCTVYKEIPIEVLQAEEYVLPEKNSIVGFLYRNFKYPNDTLKHYYKDDHVIIKDTENLDKNIDSLVVTSCLSSVSSAMLSNGAIGKAVLFPAEMMPQLIGEKNFPIPSVVIQKLAHSANVSYLVSLETLSYCFSHFSDESIDEYNMLVPGESEQVVMAAVWILYGAEKGKVLDSKVMIDTIYWSAGDDHSGRENAILPPRLPAILQASEIFGKEYAMRFYPEWRTVNRLLIIPPLEEFRLAAEFASDQDWEKAREIWERYSNGRLGRLAVTARYNMALSYEISDDLDAAIHWLDQCFFLAKEYKSKQELEMILTYKSILLQRKKMIDRLKLMEKSG